MTQKVTNFVFKWMEREASFLEEGGDTKNRNILSRQRNRPSLRSALLCSLHTGPDGGEERNSSAMRGGLWLFSSGGCCAGFRAEKNYFRLLSVCKSCRPLFSSTKFRFLLRESAAGRNEGGDCCCREVLVAEERPVDESTSPDWISSQGAEAEWQQRLFPTSRQLKRVRRWHLLHGRPSSCSWCGRPFSFSGQFLFRLAAAAAFDALKYSPSSTFL